MIISGQRAGFNRNGPMFSAVGVAEHRGSAFEVFRGRHRDLLRAGEEALVCPAARNPT
jgi:hypothetical protein